MRVISAYACLGEMALMELHSSTRRSATAIATEEAHTIVVPKALYDAVLRTKQSAEMRAKFRLFRHVDWLTSLAEVDRKNVGYAMGLALWPRGAVIATRGSEFQGIMLLRQGHVAILRQKDARLRETREEEGAAVRATLSLAAVEMDVVGRRGPGEMFGEQALLHGGVHPHTIVAESPLEVFCLRLPVRAPPAPLLARAVYIEAVISRPDHPRSGKHVTSHHRLVMRKLNFPDTCRCG